MVVFCWSHDSQGVFEIDEFKVAEISSPECEVLERTVWRKLDRHVLSLCSVLYVLISLDQVNVGNARVAGMQASLGLSNYQFTVALTATCVSCVIAMFPLILLLKHVGPQFMLPGLAVLFSTISASQGFISNFSGLLACRFCLGLIESGLFAGLFLYLSFFYPRKRLQIRVATLTATTSLCLSLSGLLAAGISRIEKTSGRPGWAWIFILEGILTFCFGVFSFFFMPHSPERARFLTEKERVYVISTLKHTGSVSENVQEDDFGWTEVIKAAESPHIWFLCILVTLNSGLMFAIGFFESTIVAGLGFVDNSAQLMSVPPFAAAFAFSFITAHIADRYQCRGFVTISSSLLQLIGFAMFYAITSNHVRYVSIFLSVIGANCATPALITWLMNNSAPYTRRAVGASMTAVSSQLAGIVVIWLLGYLSPAPNYTLAMIIFMVSSVCMVVLSTANLIYLWQANRSKMRKREFMQREEEPKGLGDRSAWFVYNL